MTLTYVQPGVELTGDERFGHRVRRLVAVSAIALGVIAWLALRADGPTWAVVLLAGGWVLMPIVLAASVSRPLVRYILVVPASLVTVGLFGMLATASGAELVGWACVTAGILVGGSLGMWFWYRWLPVPAPLDDPYGTPRLVFIAIHVALVLGGAAIVLIAT